MGMQRKKSLLNLECSTTNTQILRSLFVRNKYDSVEYTIERKQIITAFEKYLKELFTEVFKLLRMEWIQLIIIHVILEGAKKTVTYTLQSECYWTEID